MDTMWHCKCEHGKDFVVMSAEVYFVTPCSPCEQLLGRLTPTARAVVARRIATDAASCWDDARIDVGTAAAA